MAVKAILQESNIVLTKYGTDCLTFKILDALGLPPDEMAKPVILAGGPDHFVDVNKTIG